jgi:hypothetical protein
MNGYLIQLLSEIEFEWEKILIAILFLLSIVDGVRLQLLGHFGTLN